MTRRTEHDPKLWRKVTRFPARLTNAVVEPASATTLAQRYVLFVNQQVSPPDDLSKPVVPDFYQTLKAGDMVEGCFHIGSNQLQDHR